MATDLRLCDLVHARRLGRGVVVVRERLRGRTRRDGLERAAGAAAALAGRLAEQELGGHEARQLAAACRRQARLLQHVRRLHMRRAGVRAHVRLHLRRAAHPGRLRRETLGQA